MRRSRKFPTGLSTPVALKLPAIAMLALWLSGCAFATLKRGIERAAQQATIAGTASGSGEAKAPIVVVAFSASHNQIADLFILPRPGPFFFVLPPGAYQLAAFEDLNRDLIYQPGDEPAVLYGDASLLILHAGDQRRGISLSVDRARSRPLPFAVEVGSTRKQLTHFPAPQLGTVVGIDDSRFSDANAKLGLWDPLHFLSDVGAGVYFLEEYDPQKIPVLFVHGALGHPGNWKSLIAQLDREHFQPWLAYYPTAPRLDRITQLLLRTLASLQAKYEFEKMVLVAHSMGGLVTRAAVNDAMKTSEANRLVTLPALITISSPWNGHRAAAAGAEYSPIAAPSWQDMAPGSSFLADLSETPLPPECEYTLLFSYRTDTLLSAEANDGAVTVASELALPIQRQAQRVLGFNETHTTILDSPEVAAELNAILKRARDRF